MRIRNAFNELLDLYVLDFETYYSTKEKYSLRGMTTTEYVRDPRFKAHGLAVIYPTGEYEWVTHTRLPEWFASIDWSNKAVMAQNAAFDALILSDHYNVVPNYYVDTMSMGAGEWGPGVSNSLEAMSKRIGRGGKVKNVLESTDGIRDLSEELEANLAEYAKVDVEETLAIFEELFYNRSFPQDEMHVIDLTIRCFADPKIQIDRGLCEAEIEDETLRMDALLNSDLIKNALLSDKCKSIITNKGMEGLMRSRPCFAELLISRGIEPPTKTIVRKTKKDTLKSADESEAEEQELEYDTYAFAKNDIELINLANDPRVSDLVAAWTGAKSTIRKSRAERFLNNSVNGTKALPIPLRYCGGRTHRWSGHEKLNAQNLTSGRDGGSTRLREALMAPKGYRLCKGDLSGIELRANAWCWNEMDILNTIKSGQDLYCNTATNIFGVEVTKTNEYKHYRHVGKEAELSLGFGVGALKFFNTVQTKYGEFVPDFTLEDAERIVHLYREKRVNIVNGWKTLGQALIHMAVASEDSAPVEVSVWKFFKHKALMPNGLYIHYRDLAYNYQEPKGWYYKFKKDLVNIYPAKLNENLIQSTARSIVSEQAVAISKRYPVVLLVHDEIVFLAPETEADEALEWGLNIMRTAPEWCADIPLDAEGWHSTCYKQMKKK